MLFLSLLGLNRLDGLCCGPIEASINEDSRKDVFNFFFSVGDKTNAKLNGVSFKVDGNKEKEFSLLPDKVGLGANQNKFGNVVSKPKIGISQ